MWNRVVREWASGFRACGEGKEMEGGGEVGGERWMGGGGEREMEGGGGGGREVGRERWRGEVGGDGGEEVHHTHP